MKDRAGALPLLAAAKAGHKSEHLYMHVVFSIVFTCRSLILMSMHGFWATHDNSSYMLRQWYICIT